MEQGPLNVGVAHPLRLFTEECSVDRDDVALVAVDAKGNRVTIVASRDRWREALLPTFGPRPSPADTARAMYVRGEVGIEVFERELERYPAPATQHSFVRSAMHERP